MIVESGPWPFPNLENDNRNVEEAASMRSGAGSNIYIPTDQSMHTHEGQPDLVRIGSRV